MIIRRLGPPDLLLVTKMNAMFREAFGDRPTGGAPPTDAYREALLRKEHVLVLAALEGDEVVGALVAYELDTFERMRREIYIYDLAVDARRRRRGVATSLIERLTEIAAERGAWVIFVQADVGEEAPIALYDKLCARKKVLQFDMQARPPSR